MDLERFRGLCTGCDRPIYEAHATIEDHIRCESEYGARALAEANAAAAKLPKRDGRFTTRGAGYKKSDIRKGRW